MRGRLPNTAAETSEVAAGVAWIDGDNNVGFSINRYDSLYGVPIRYSLDPAIEAEAPTHRPRARPAIDGRAEIDTGDGFVDSVRFRGGYSDYRHFEIEDTGEIATTFINEGWEGAARGASSRTGAAGAAASARNISTATSASTARRSSCRPTSTRQFGLFTLQTLDLGAFKAEAGARYEHSRLHADADAGHRQSRPHAAASTPSPARSAAATRWRRGSRVGLNGSHSERAPSAEELFANGPHAGTQAFEIGDPDSSTRKAAGASRRRCAASGDGYQLRRLGLPQLVRRLHLRAADRRDRGRSAGLPVSPGRRPLFRHRARGLGSRRARSAASTINVDGVADYVRATIDGVGPAPRIPPLRLLGGIEAQSELVDGRIEVEWVSDQDRIAAFETPTDGYTMVNASLAFHPFGDDNDSSIVLSANNIFDVDARRHASFLKDYAPLAGRDLRISARVTF